MRTFKKDDYVYYTTGKALADNPFSGSRGYILKGLEDTTCMLDSTCVIKIEVGSSNEPEVLVSTKYVTHLDPKDDLVNLIEDENA